jgi:predicted deacylase
MRRLIAIAILVVVSWAAPPSAISAEDAKIEPAPEGNAGVWPPFPDTDGVAVDALPELDVEAAPTVTFELLGMRIAPGERVTLDLELSESFTGGAVVTPVQVVRGDQPGSVLCLVAGLHGDEVVGIEVVRRVVTRIEPVGMNGTVVAIPVANPVGFRRLSRYLPDRRDLNRHFPGRSYGSSASRMAYRIFEGVIRHCDVLVDFHSGSFHRANLPQVRADLDNPILLAISGWFGAPVVVDSPGAEGTLRYAAVQAGIDALLYEAGEPMRFDEGSVETGVQGVLSLMKAMRMAELDGPPPNVSEFFRGSHWVRSDSGGIFLAEVQLGAWVKQGQVLGSVTSPFTNERRDVRARETGRVIGRAVDQVVSPGYALFHVGTIEEKPFGNEEPPVDREDTEPLERDERPE